ncbi:hypothetical protein FIBSPDRAFT_461797 [Athelia psychrophila]|uniref:Uncharacterized protein n=1 Tax=Athelia psychrophila TaxID=1759441 RepID=A0A166LW76_9AGAM|nr:hypothetical protein FIBSPDRAFT_461797 [Fibularhizoctonia sp. CBS 109695]
MHSLAIARRNYSINVHPGRPVPIALQVSREEQQSMKIPESSLNPAPAPTQDNSGSATSKRKRASSSDSRKRQK